MRNIPLYACYSASIGCSGGGCAGIGCSGIGRAGGGLSGCDGCAGGGNTVQQIKKLNAVYFVTCRCCCNY